MRTGADIHATALHGDGPIGQGTRVGAFASLAPDAVVGARCRIGDGATIGPGVVLDDDVAVAAGARLVAGVQVASGAVIHENAVVMPGVSVGRGAVLEAGTVAADTVPANAIVRGNPAVIVGYVGDAQAPVEADAAPSALLEGPVATRVPGVSVLPLTCVRDLRGGLMAADFTELPFIPQRVFAVLDVPSELIRGSHAHRACEQFLVCLAGSIHCVVDDGENRDEIHLETPDRGLHLPAMVWGTQYKYSRDAVLLVLASDPYDADDYIRDYDEFLALASAR